MSGRGVAIVLCAGLLALLVVWGGTAPVAMAFLAGGALGAAVIWANSRDAAVIASSRREARLNRRRDVPVAAILDAAPNPCVLLDRRANVVHANSAARAAFPALQPAQPLSFALRDPVVLQAVNQCLAAAVAQDIELVERQPVERSFACSVAPVEGADEKGSRAGAALLVMRDTSQERAVEAMRVDFVANASHELRTPLASVLGFIETIQGPARNDPVARDKFLGIMADQARRMARLVDDLLSLSRVEMKGHLAPQDTVDLSAVLAQTVHALSHLADERGLVLALEQPATPVLVTGDRDELLSVFDNLIENAIKYGKSGKRVEIALTVDTDALVRVRDFGPGIAPEHVPRLTERFYRVDSALSRSEGGTGLGLALVKHTIRRHRGQFTIASRPGEGSVFAVTLPLAPSAT